MITDKERLDWLELYLVEVRNPLVYGSRHMFYAVPEQEEGEEESPSDLRDQIDQHIRKKNNEPT